MWMRSSGGDGRGIECGIGRSELRRPSRPTILPDIQLEALRS